MLTKLKRKECYQGCFSKWQRQRKQNAWDAFVDVAPAMAKQCSEVPNSLRNTLNISTMKWNGSKFGKSSGLHIVPDPLCLAIEALLVDAMTTGQEIGLSYIMKTMDFMISQWNDNITVIREHINEVIKNRMECGDHIQSCQSIVSANGQHVTGVSNSDPVQRMLELLQPCNISETTDGRKSLGCNIVFLYNNGHVCGHSVY